MYLLNRHWVLSVNQPNGTFVAQVHADDNEGDTLEYGIEPRYDYSVVPFRIDEKGVVYTNRSLLDLVRPSLPLRQTSLYL